MSAKTIHDLPTEVLVSIFSRLKLQSVIQEYSRTCLRWKRIIAKYFLEPHLLKITEFDEDLSLGIKLLTKDGFDLTENCNDPDLVMSIYYDLECFESKNNGHEGHFITNMKNTYSSLPLFFRIRLCFVIYFQCPKYA